MLSNTFFKIVLTLLLPIHFPWNVQTNLYMFSEITIRSNSRIICIKNSHNKIQRSYKNDIKIYMYLTFGRENLLFALKAQFAKIHLSTDHHPSCVYFTPQIFLTMIDSHKNL